MRCLVPNDTFTIQHLHLKLREHQQGRGRRIVRASGQGSLRLFLLENVREATCNCLYMLGLGSSIIRSVTVGVGFDVSMLSDLWDAVFSYCVVLPIALTVTWVVWVLMGPLWSKNTWKSFDNRAFIYWIEIFIWTLALPLFVDSK